MEINIKRLDKRIALTVEYISKFYSITLVSVYTVKVMAKLMDDCRFYCCLTLFNENFVIIKISYAFHGKTELDAAGFIRADENDKRAPA